MSSTFILVQKILPSRLILQCMFLTLITCSRSHNSIVYHHGNAASRAAPNRLRVARLMSAENVNFLIYDYRGFADSTGKPSEEGLLIDARTAWNYLNLEKKVSSDKISIMGQSLGTGVSVSLTASLATENIIPRSVILVAPFTSIPHLLEDFKLFSFIPILSPFKTIPGAIKLFLNVLVTQFDSKSIIDVSSLPFSTVNNEKKEDRTLVRFIEAYTNSKKIFFFPH